MAAPDGDLMDALAAALPVAPTTVRLAGRRGGLVIVDEVNGFATVGAGNLAPPVENAEVRRMVAETDRLARECLAAGWPVLAFLDTHVPGKPEPPYPPHCEAGTGEEDLVPALAWLATHKRARMVRKDCINGFVGAIRGDGTNAFVEWVNAHRLDSLVVVGICTDICVMDLVLTLLSARNHGLMPTLGEVVVYEPGCATYDLPAATAARLGYGRSAAHPQGPTHHMGLYFMAARGATIAGALAD